MTRNELTPIKTQEPINWVVAINVVEEVFSWIN